MDLSNLGYLLPGSKKLYVDLYYIKDYTIDLAEPLSEFSKVKPENLTISDYKNSKKIYRSKCGAILVCAKSYRNNPRPFIYIHIDIHNIYMNAVQLESTEDTDMFIIELRKANEFMKSFK